MAALDGTRVGRSGISAPTSLALHLDADLVLGPDDAHRVGTEFAHFHGDGSGRLHMTLPLVVAHEAVDRGWAELHPAAGIGSRAEHVGHGLRPRDDAELAVTSGLVSQGYDYARGL